MGQMRNLIISSEHGLHLLSRHGVPVASNVSKQTKKQTKYFMSIFVDRAIYQPCVLFSRASDDRDPYVQEKRYCLGWSGEFPHNTKGLESTTESIKKQLNAQKEFLFTYIAEIFAQKRSNQEEALNISLHQYRSTVERVVQMFFATEAILLETTFVFQAEARRDAPTMRAVKAHVVLDDAAYKSCGRQQDIHERETTTSTDDRIALQASTDGITYIKSVMGCPRHGIQANENES